MKPSDKSRIDPQGHREFYGFFKISLGVLARWVWSVGLVMDLFSEINNVRRMSGSNSNHLGSMVSRILDFFLVLLEVELR